MGLVRELEFLAPLEVSHNLLNGGLLPGRAQFSVNVGDRLRIETPGGGGYGAP